MTRFVAILPGSDPGARLRLENDPDIGLLVLADENVQPEQLHNPDARNVSTVANVSMDEAQLLWLHEQTGLLLAQLGILTRLSLAGETS